MYYIVVLYLDVSCLFTRNNSHNQSNQQSKKMGAFGATSSFHRMSFPDPYPPSPPLKHLPHISCPVPEGDLARPPLRLPDRDPDEGIGGKRPEQLVEGGVGDGGCRRLGLGMMELRGLEPWVLVFILNQRRERIWRYGIVISITYRGIVVLLCREQPPYTSEMT